MIDKFTPGPWAFRHDTGHITSDEGDPIGDVSCSENIDYATAKANGILQSSAPDLLHALEIILDEWYFSEVTQKTVNNARLAIAKARGEL